MLTIYYLKCGSCPGRVTQLVRASNPYAKVVGSILSQGTLKKLWFSFMVQSSGLEINIPNLSLHKHPLLPCVCVRAI